MRGLRMVIWLFSGMAAAGCSLSLVLWTVRGNEALFRFVRGGKAGFIDRTGRIVVPAILQVPNGPCRLRMAEAAIIPA